jgi:hypothetical protein
MQTKTITKGIYRHYKGNLYEVLDLARHSESLEYMVVYKALYGDFGLWVRPYDMFIEDVIVDNQSKKRFQFIGDTK